ncbi:aldehyde dehydrogenase family protein [Pseudooceanicola sp. HF7]|uniref:aldehyde dehydrogenase family protein n=1 Tax=Pseudooceanicola sp. HF7 TaxID=2721560 RepID=UPI00143194B2|nr:aldehyde dehydrogenase family protein [Pseudooceanicola sp. HF7]NIZ08455.1 aldehyde dehydrogenase family protein [Pseudooceanicola sp. HF7]
MTEDKTAFYINGAWVAPHASTRMEVENPATEETVAQIALADAEDVDAAVAAAHAAFPAWSTTTPAQRIAVLQRILQVTRDRYEDLARAITTEMGAPISMSRSDQAGVAIGHLEGFLEAMEDFDWEEVLPNGDRVVKEAAGVCALITPWNWPMNQIVLKVLPALAAGCTCVLKPSELTPLSAMVYAEILHEAGVPPGVFNLVNGTGPEAGTRLTRHRDVRLVSFTGSTRAGVAISQGAADSVKRVALELGGKSPNLVFADCAADLEQRVRDSVAEVMLNTGQSCDAPTRMIVESSVYDQVCAIAADAIAGTKLGDPTQEGDHIGPLASGIQWQRVQDFISAGIEEGARLLAGGEGLPDGPTCGHFARPTLFADVTPQMTIWQEEIFGPVLCLTPFSDEADAIRLANDTEYGLAAYVQTGDRDRAERLSRALRAGMVHFNGQGMGWGSPFGGYGLSGKGREGGKYGIEEFLEVKAVLLPEGWR